MKNRFATLALACLLALPAAAQQTQREKPDSMKAGSHPPKMLQIYRDKKTKTRKSSQTLAQFLRNKLALPGVEREGGPTAAAEQDYANRAYPAAYVPFSATLNARRAFQKVQESGNSNIGTWKLIGPSTTNFPDVLTFSGAPYVTSGRITALAIDPSCNTTTCRVWTAAAGGGVWRTDNALSTRRMRLEH